MTNMQGEHSRFDRVHLPTKHGQCSWCGHYGEDCTALADALAIVKAVGYRVTKPKAKPERTALGLNAIGKPYGENYDPNYRRNYKPPLIKTGGQSVDGISPEKWEIMCATAKAQWAQWERGEIESLPVGGHGLGC